MFNKICLIGCGGVASHMAAALVTSGAAIIAADGDEFEEANQDRQTLAIKYPGGNKAEAFEAEFGFTAFPHFIDKDNIVDIVGWGPDLVISAVDNDIARDIIWGNFNGRTAILWGSNEVWSPQAGLSLPKHPWDPRTWLPKRPVEDQAVGCGTQTRHANMAAANLALALMAMHSDEENENNPIFLAHEHGGLLTAISPSEL